VRCRRGLITEIDAPRAARGKARRVYEPTDEGRRACARSAEAAVAELRLDRRAAAALTEKIAGIGAARDAQADVPGFVRAIFDYALGQLAAEQQWLPAYRAAELGDRSPPPPPERQTAMIRYDVKQELKQCYAPRNTDWALVDVPAQRFIAIDGRGDPNTSADYARAVEALYTVAYTIKFTSKTALGRTSSSGRSKGCGGPTARRCSPPAPRTPGTGAC
jgi:hypothetical protein